MEHEFDQRYWDDHWQNRGDGGGAQEIPPNPYLVRETREVPPGTALDAGCGEGAEAIWLANAGWAVTAVDIAGDALGRARDRAAAHDLSEDAVRWVRADLGTWEPSAKFDLVTTHYAHPAMPQLDFYVRLSEWVAPNGSLLVVGHLHGAHDEGQNEGHGTGHGAGHGTGHGTGHRDGPPAEATATAAAIEARLDPERWDVVTAEEQSRVVDTPGGRQVTLHDVVVRAVRRPGTSPA